MRILVAHPFRMIAEAMGSILASEDGFEVVGVCQEKASAIETATFLHPDLIVIGGLFPEHEITRFADAIKEQCPKVGVLVVTNSPRSSELIAILDAGVEGYLTYDCGTADLVEAIHKVEAGEVVVLGIERNALNSRSHLEDKSGSKVRVESLTPREREVLDLLSEGFSNKQIAETLYVSEHTVRTHIQNLRTKLNVRSKFEAAMWVMKSSGQREVRDRF